MRNLLPSDLCVFTLQLWLRPSEFKGLSHQPLRPDLPAQQLAGRCSENGDSARECIKAVSNWSDLYQVDCYMWCTTVDDWLGSHPLLTRKTSLTEFLAGWTDHWFTCYWASSQLIMTWRPNRNHHASIPTYTYMESIGKEIKMKIKIDVLLVDNLQSRGTHAVAVVMMDVSKWPQHY